jgi:hypothetical protein
MQNAHGFSIDRAELVALEPLMEPDGLQQAFRRYLPFFAKGPCQSAALPPCGVLISVKWEHLT